MRAATHAPCVLLSHFYSTTPKHESTMLTAPITFQPRQAHTLDVSHEAVHSSAHAPTAIGRVIDSDVLTVRQHGRDVSTDSTIRIG